MGWLIDDFRLVKELWGKIEEHLLLAASEAETKEYKKRCLALIKRHRNIKKEIQQFEAEALALLGPQHI